MVWQEKTSVIVMLTGLVEQNKIKCEQYWPEQEQVYGDFTVTLNNTWTTTGLVKRIFCLQKAGCALPRAVEQFHYLLWPDHGVPRNASQLLCLVEVVNKRVLEAPAGPVLVHCSAGIGRTGTFIALDFLLKMGKAEGKVDVFHCVQQLREQRVGMVQTKEQYSFLYEALLEGLLCGNTAVPVESITPLVHSLREDETTGHRRVLEKEFKALQRFSELFQLLPCREAENPRNQPKNRKPGILPADSCRPILMSSVNADGSPAYINAVFASVRLRPPPDGSGSGQRGPSCAALLTARQSIPPGLRCRSPGAPGSGCWPCCQEMAPAIGGALPVPAAQQRVPDTARGS
ncbi:receptor-type tyrosine-protein phosphatase U-like [Catharus ustulatus]|uniref:receptor-type tyrosine-protein phosphatase U-like n=1 Tax=Catharus ustulatus TaxID=91951 RepID=UPI00140B8008|nr:receptor-type tyrosine-protein phosphatase U-like [Catharus ustulatus]